MAKLEEMERLLREAQAEKRSMLEHKVTPSISVPVFWSFPNENRNGTFLFLDLIEISAIVFRSTGLKYVSLIAK